MQSYVAGFLFSLCEQSVALIEKRTPEWQRGYLNGIGGKNETGETPCEAMAREFQEEAGLKTAPENWTTFAIVTRPNHYEVHFMFSHDARIHEVRSQEQEQVCIHNPANLPKNVLPNLRWLIAMSLDKELDFSSPILMRESGSDSAYPNLPKLSAVPHT